MSEIENKDKMAEELWSAKRKYEFAMSHHNGVNMARERLKNTLFNYCEQLLGLLDENKKLRREAESLNREIDALDAALRKANDDAKRLKKPKGTERTDADGSGQA